MLVLARKIDEKIVINHDIVITVVGIEGDKVKIAVEAPDNVEINRLELYRRKFPDGPGGREAS